MILENSFYYDGNEVLRLELFRSIVWSPQLDAKLHFAASLDMKRYLESNPDLVSARLLNELTTSLSSVEPCVAEHIMAVIGKRDRTQDEESWLALDSLINLCVQALALEWTEIDWKKCIDDFKNSTVPGDNFGSSRLAVTRLASAVDEAKVAIDRANAKIGLLESENAD